jgi:hypothetical protein
MANYSKEFLERSIKVWQPHSKELLSIEGGREIATNAANLSEYLIELDKKYPSGGEMKAGK